MSVTTTGIEVRARSRWLRDAVELLSSMRFSISLLTVICIAAVIGTIVSQHEPFTNYVNKFGPFWAQLFLAVGLDTVYSVWWFLLILAFLVVSTSLCVARNTPKIIHDLRTYKEGMREQSLVAFHHKGSAELAQGSDAVYARVSKLLVDSGWRASNESIPVYHTFFSPANRWATSIIATARDKSLMPTSTIRQICSRLTNR